jgi:hypothetical protein
MGQMASPKGAALEDRVFELLACHTTNEIAAELGLTRSEAATVVRKVVNERGTPNLVASRAALDRLRESIQRI